MIAFGSRSYVIEKSKRSSTIHCRLTTTFADMFDGSELPLLFWAITR